jgi:broad specificity phosphatase PhoE
MESNELLNEVNITFVRHGTTEYNEQNRVQGSSDIPLSMKGYNDIEKVDLKHTNYDYYFHSPLMRSRDTLYGIMEKYGTIPNPKNVIETTYVTERGYGIFEGLTPNEIEEKYNDLYHHWLVDENVKGENIESIENVIGRIQRFISKTMAYSHKKLLVVTHSGFLYALYKFITGSPLHLKPKDFTISFPNCCVVDLQILVHFHYIELNLKMEDKIIQKIIKHS